MTPTDPALLTPAEPETPPAEPVALLPGQAPDSETAGPADGDTPETEEELPSANITAGSPVPEEEELSGEAPVPTVSTAVKPGAVWLRTVLPRALAGIASLVFASCAALAVLDLRLNRTRAELFLLGSVFGGRKNIVVLTSSNGSEGSERRASEIETPVSEAQSSTDEETDMPETVPGSPGAGSMSVLEDEAEETEAEEEQDGRTGSDPFPILPLRLTNETGYEPDLAACAEARAIPPLGDLPEETGGDEPLVLILHTHGTEAYRECAGGNYRSRDPSLSVLCLGEQLADRLNGAGISALRLSDLFDAPDFNLAYSNAASAIRDTLALYPSIRYIFDLHRDSVVLGDGTVCRTSASLEDGTRAAQMMFVVGTDEAGAIHPGWRDNLGLAVRLQTALNREHPNLMRDINLRSASFNEQYTPGSLLIEIGSSGCSLEEAKKAADLLADALIAEIRGEE